MMDQSQHSRFVCLTYRVEVGDAFSLKDRDGSIFAPSGRVAGPTKKHWRGKEEEGGEEEEEKEKKELREGKEEEALSGIVTFLKQL